MPLNLSPKGSGIESIQSFQNSTEGRRPCKLYVMHHSLKAAVSSPVSGSKASKCSWVASPIYEVSGDVSFFDQYVAPSGSSIDLIIFLCRSKALLSWACDFLAKTLVLKYSIKLGLSLSAKPSMSVSKGTSSFCNWPYPYFKSEKESTQFSRLNGSIGECIPS